MIKYLSLDLQGTLSSSDFSDYFWLEILPKKYAEKFAISINEAKQILKIKFKEYGIYNILYYDDKYWSEYLNFNLAKELIECNVEPKINKKLFEFIRKLELPKIIISTTTRFFIDYELKDKVKLFDKVYSCVDYFGVGGKTKEIYEKICKELKVKPEEILHIGDNQIMDIDNAKAVGINTIYFDSNVNVDDVIKEIKKYSIN